MHRRRDLLILAVLFVALVVFTILGPGQSRDENMSSSPTTHSSAPGGALALLRWTNAIGYDSRRLEFTDFHLDNNTDALFILNPSEAINLTQTDIILDWVDAGGTLILVEAQPFIFRGNNALLDELGVSVEHYRGDPAIIRHAPVVQPLLNNPAVRSVQVRTGFVLHIEEGNAAVLVGLPDPKDDEQDTEESTSEKPEEQGNSDMEADTLLRAVIAGIKHGRGYIYVSSSIFPFTNEGLRDTQNSAMVLNMLRHIPPEGDILFDEWHHGFFEPPSLRSILLSNPWGQALIYALVVLAAYMVLTGRRFGRPVPLREEVALRSSAEYVENMADLYQRGGKRGFIQQHYYTDVKRRLARPYGISPHLDDEAFVRDLATYQGAAPSENVLNLLKRLRNDGLSEAELLRMVAESDEVLKHSSKGRS